MTTVMSPLTTPSTGDLPFVSVSVRNRGAPTSAQTVATPSTPKASATSSQPLDAEALKKIVSEMQSKLAGTNSDLEFSVDKDSGHSVVKVTERTTKQLIWQFPSDQALQVSKELSRFLGAFVNRSA